MIATIISMVVILNLIKNFIKHIIVYDTYITEKTVDVIKKS